VENVTAPSPVKERQGGAQGVMGTRVPASMIIHEIMDDHDLVKPWFIHVYTHKKSWFIIYFIPEECMIWFYGDIYWER